MSFERTARWVQQFLIDLWVHHGFTLSYERMPVWAKVTAGVVSAGLVFGGFLVVKASKAHLRAGNPDEIWVKRGDKISKVVSERVVRIVEVSEKDIDSGPGPL